MESTNIDKVIFDRTDGDGMEEEKVARVERAQVTTKGKNETQRFVPRKQVKRKDSLPIKENIHTRKSSIIESLPLPGLHTLYRRPEIVTRSIAPVVPKGELVQLKPRIVGELKNLPEHKKTKPPKFIPYEPYPGAVTALESKTKVAIIGGHITPQGKNNKNNLDIGILVGQMSSIRTQELQGEEESRVNSAPQEMKAEISKLKEELESVKKERAYYQGQFKFQTQVNAELKNLLVASVGEDLQTRVNVLTEDKLQLARALLDTANNLSTHTEQIEFLAGQCEVWRSKFLASSVMVEELARWKADLSHKNLLLNDATKRLLQSMRQLRDMQLEILKNLKFVAKIRYLNLPATDVLSLSAENLNILQQMVLHSGMHGIPEAQLNILSASSNPLSEAEKNAIHALELISQPLMATDEAIRALFGQTMRPFINQDAIAIGDDHENHATISEEDSK